MSAEPEPIPDEIDEAELPGGGWPDESWSLAETLDFHLNRIRWYRHKIAQLEVQRDRMVRRYQDWFERVTSPWQRKVAESEAWVTYAHLEAIDADPKHPKVMRLPSGVVRAVPPRPSVVVDDPEAFKDWILGHPDAERLSRFKVEPIKDEIRKVLQDGEIVPGMSLSPGEVRVTVHVEDDE